LECIAGIEELSEHPVAKSIVAKAKEAKLKPHEFAQFQAVMGKGIKGNCTVCVDKHHCVGSLKFITEEHNVGLDVVRKVEEFEKQGKTTIVISDHKKVSGVVSIVDEIREESKSTVEILKKMGVTPVMLTGDNKSSAEYVASLLGIQIVYAELLPEDKMEKVKMLEKKYRHVGMIGDGVNDAPALATASVGIAMGAIGSDLAVENADIALMNTNLSVLPYLIDLGKRSISTIQFNTALAIIVKFVFLLLALAGRSTIAAAIFADVGVTLLVILNSLQLFQTKALPSSLSSS
jgi:Cd2+/Zn2+-exporting ATPase